MSYKRALQLYLHACTGSVHVYHIGLISNSSSTFFKSMRMKVIPASLVDILWDGAPGIVPVQIELFSRAASRMLI